MKVIKNILIVIGILLGINALILLLTTNLNFGTVITLVSGTLITLLGYFLEKILEMTRTGILRWIKYAVIAAVVFVIGLMLFLAVYGNMDNATYREDALIVLGAGIRGEEVSLPLKYRLDAALEYAQRNPDALVIVSGGQGFQEDITEALAMERYLLKAGIPQERIIKEEKAASTYENFMFSKQILDKRFPDGYHAAFVTNDFHVYRAARLAQLAGINAAHVHAPLEWYSVSINYIRECFAVFQLWILKR